MKNSATVYSLHPNGVPADSYAQGNARPKQVFFTRQELQSILHIYGQYVAAGKWRDYAMDMLSDFAIFSIFQRSSEAPLYTIIKDPSLARKQGAWRIVSMSGQIVKRGHDLQVLLKYFDEK